MLAALFAAVLLGIRLSMPPAPEATVLPEPERIPQLSPEKQSAAASVSASPAAQPALAEADVVTIRVLTPVSGGEDASGMNTLQTFHAAFVARLSAIPGVRVITDSTQQSGESDLEVTIAFDGWSNSSIRLIRVESRGLRGGSGVGGAMVTAVMPGDDLDSLAARQVEGLWLRPVQNPQLQQKLRAQLLDPRAGWAARQQALVKLLGQSGAGAGPASDVTVLLAGASVAAAAVDPESRRSTWHLLRGMPNPELVAPLVDALAAEREEKVRLELTTILASDYRGDPDAIAALQSLARGDMQELVRMAARRALPEDSGWNEYVVSTLRNGALTDARRLEPLVYMSSSIQAPPDQLREVLDDAAIQDIGVMLARMGRDRPPQPIAFQAASLLASIRNSVARDVLLDILRAGADQTLRMPVLASLAARQGNDMAVRKVVEEIAAGDPDPQLRARAVEALWLVDKVRSKVSFPR